MTGVSIVVSNTELMWKTVGSVYWGVDISVCDGVDKYVCGELGSGTVGVVLYVDRCVGAKVGRGVGIGSGVYRDIGNVLGRGDGKEV